MRSACIALLLAAAVLSAEAALFGIQPRQIGDSEEFHGVVDYLNEIASGNDILDIIECMNDALDELAPEDGERSVGTVVGEMFDQIPWDKVNQYIEKKLAGHPKFAKIYSMVNDSRFRQLIDDALKSQSLRNYLKSIESNGFTWSNMVAFAFKALCETAIMSHHDSYPVEVCKALKNL